MKTRIIVVFGESVQDLGIWAYRTIGTEGINIGSAVDFAKAVIRDSSHDPGESRSSKSSTGLILTNPGQLVWYCAGEKAISLPTWHAIPRRNAVEPPMRMTIRNKIPGNETWQDHITHVFENVLGKIISKDTKIDIIGLAEGGLGAVRYLAERCMFSKHLHPDGFLPHRKKHLSHVQHRLVNLRHVTALANSLHPRALMANAHFSNLPFQPPARQKPPTSPRIRFVHVHPKPCLSSLARIPRRACRRPLRVRLQLLLIWGDAERRRDHAKGLGQYARLAECDARESGVRGS